MDGPFITWIASYSKSGNTWARLLLSRLVRGDAWTPDDAESFAPWFARVGADRRPDLDRIPPPHRPAAIASTWRERQAGLRDLARRDGRRDAFVKTHNLNADLAGYSFTNASVTRRVVYLIRDPRDVLISFANHMDAPLDAIFDTMTDPERYGHFGDAHSELWGDWATHVRSWAGFERRPVHALRYEDLRADPQAALRALCGFLEWEVDDAAIAAACDATALEKMQAYERATYGGGMLGGRPFYRVGGVGVWRDHPRADLFDGLAERFGGTMADWGYA